MTKYKDDLHPWTHMLEEDFGTKIPKVYGIFINFEASLFIRDPDMLNEIFGSKNKYFDKHPSTKISFLLFSKIVLFWTTAMSYGLQSVR